jgi:hypothetical protein
LSSLWRRAYKTGCESVSTYRCKGPPELEFLKSLWGLGTEEE